MNFVDYEARRDVLCLVSNVDHPTYSGQGYAQDEILDNLVLSITSSWVSWVVNITDQT